jgi:hypothetical protein
VRLLTFCRTAAFALAFTALTPLASGAVTGTLRITSDPGDVSVTADTINWRPTVNANDGPFTVGAGTTLTYGAGTALTIGTQGTILDLIFGMPFPVLNFMTFDDAPNLSFDLTDLGPGPNNTVCSAVFNPNAPACSVFAGSPFILSATATGTAVTLSASGIARDGSLPVSTWLGAFTTQIAGRTPAQIQANILGGGSETSTYSGEFVATFTPIPEPSTVSLVLLGGGLVALGIRRRAAR